MASGAERGAAPSSPDPAGIAREARLARAETFLEAGERLADEGACADLPLRLGVRAKVHGTFSEELVEIQLPDVEAREVVSSLAREQRRRRAQAALAAGLADALRGLVAALDDVSDGPLGSDKVMGVARAWIRALAGEEG